MFERLTRAGRETVEIASHVASRLGAEQVEPEHLLLGLLRPPPAAVGRVLMRLDVDPERLAALVQVEAAAWR